MPRASRGVSTRKTKRADSVPEKRSRALEPANPYPYRIPPIPSPSPEDLKHIHPQSVIDILEVETLMRSETVMEKYRASAVPPNRLLQDYEIHEDVLRGGHHYLLGIRRLLPARGLQKQLQNVGVTILEPEGDYKGHPNLLVSIEVQDRSKPAHTFELRGTPDLITQIRHQRPSSLYLHIDVIRPPTAILKALQKLLRARHKKVMAASKKQKGKPRYSLQVWLDYFKCYDLKKSGYSWNGVGERVYPPGGVRARNRARAAVKRVDDLIDAAEERMPPFPSL